MSDNTPQDSTRQDSVYQSTSTLGGHGLKASTDIKARDIIFQVHRPLIVALDTPRLNDTCYHCFRTLHGALVADNGNENKLKRCSGCKTVRYCSSPCAKIAWGQYHKHECKAFARFQPRVLPSNVRGIVRLLVLQQVGRIDQKEWQDFMDLESHLEDFVTAGGETLENLMLMAKAAHAYSQTDLNEQTVLNIFARVMVNCFTLVTDTFDPIGLVLHPLPSRMNHSCKPNAYLRCSRNGGMHVVSLENIERDDEIVISYIDDTYPTRIRQKELKERYFFTCQCIKCQKPYDCDFDLKPLTDDHKQQIFATEARVSELLKSAQADSGASAPLNKLEYAIHLLHKQNWPLHQQPFPEVRHAYIVTLLAAEQYNVAFAQALIQHLEIDSIIIPDYSHPIPMIHGLLLVRLMALIKNTKEWASQKIDLTEYGFIFEYLSKDLLVKLRFNADTDQGAWLLREVEREWQKLEWYTVSPEVTDQQWLRAARAADDELAREKARTFE